MNANKKKRHEGHYEEYHKEHWMWSSSHIRGKSGCKACNFVVKGNPSVCPNCGFEYMINLGTKARPPRKNASKRKWTDFWKKFG